MQRVGTLIRRKVQTGDLKVQVMSDSRQLGMSGLDRESAQV